MRKFLLIVIAAVSLAGCASLEDGLRYAELAEAHSFDYYFPSASFTRTFASLDEASEFINTAQAKFASSVMKKSAKGLSARLVGDKMDRGEQVTLVCILAGSTKTDSIDLSKAGEPLEGVLKGAVSATCIFLVFYDGRGAAVTRFYLKDGYQYNSNSQYKGFTVRGDSFTAEYPVGWGVKKAVQYLKKEID